MRTAPELPGPASRSYRRRRSGLDDLLASGVEDAEEALMELSVRGLPTKIGVEQRDRAVRAFRSSWPTG